MKAPTYAGGLVADGMMTIKDCVREGGAGRKTWEQAAASGEIASTRIGRRLLIPRKSFYAFLEARTKVERVKPGRRLKVV